MSLETVIDALEAHGCNPRQVDDGLWLAACPNCRDQGRFGLLEIHATAEGVQMACADDPDTTDGTALQ
jgi:hypothetical protein